ncbi:MAG TPA: hypothetical protein DHV36_19290 [Desulfobacteraceae bacterium]|nr:hypothetical protein [Desulfobacteraceae bacterium]
MEKYLKVFLVEDSATFARSLADAVLDIPRVRLLGQASSIKSAKEQLSLDWPELLILDFKLPDGNAVYLLNWIRASGVAMVCVVFTGYPYPEYRRLCIAAGADYFFEKDRDNDRLLQLIAELSAHSL